MRLEDLDGYEAARAEYDGAVTAAKAAGDELAELRAQLAWRDKQDGFRSQRDGIVAAAAATASALERAKSTYPNAPEVVYSGLKDPAAIEAAAKQAHEAIAAATQGNQQFKPPAQQWPQPPTGNPPPPQGNHDFDDPVRWQEQMNKIETMHKQPNEGVGNREFKKAMDYVVERLWTSPLKNAQQ